MNEGRLLTETALTYLKERIAASDQQAFKQLFHFYTPRLNQFAFSLVKSKEAAAEIVDEVFIKVWKQRQGLPGISNLNVYLYRAVKNTCLNYLSQRARQLVTEPFDLFDAELSVEHDNPEKKMITSELMKKIVAVVEALPPRCKMVFKLVREDGLKYKEVAEILNISPKTVDAQMVIAMRQISEQVKMDVDLFSKTSLKKV